MTGFHVTLSYGDVFRQSGYRTKVLGELYEYESRGPFRPVLIAFDRDAARLAKQDLNGVPVFAHGRKGVLQYYRDLRRLSSEQPIRIVHAHNLYSGALALSARRIFGYKVLLELHGRIPEEYIVLGKGGRIPYQALRHLESWVVRGADHVIPISERLKAYLVAEYRLQSSDLTVIPDCADPGVFRWDTQQRAAARKRLEVENKFVCVHLGSVFIWYDADLILKAFTQIHNRVPASHLLVVTEDVARTREYLAKHLASDLFTVMGVPHDDVPALLSASDLGFLLLRSTENIKVSSPSKFSEYLNSGLPVLITPEVGDFSSLVASNGVGTIVTDEGDFDVGFAQDVLRSRDAFAQRCVAAGRQVTWDAYRPAWTRIVERLVDRADDRASVQPFCSNQ